MFFQFCLVFSYGFNLFLLLSISALIPFSFSFFVYSFKIILKFCDFLFFSLSLNLSVIVLFAILCQENYLCFCHTSYAWRTSTDISFSWWRFFTFAFVCSDSILVCSYTSFMLEYFLSMSFFSFFISMYLSFSSACSTIVALYLLPKILS